MRRLLRRSGACAAVFATVASAAAAFAHGGGYDQPLAPGDPGPPLGPPWHPPHIVDPPATPGSNDPKVAITRWETWWAANKNAWLRLSERLAGDAPNTTPSKTPLSERAVKAAEKKDEALRARLAALFIEALSDKEFEVRTAAAVALGKTGDASASEPLRAAATKDPHKDVRDSAVLGLGLLGRPTDIPFLERMLYDREELPRRRAFAAFALGLIGGDDAAVSLLRFVDGPPEGRPVEDLHKRPELAASTFLAMGMTGGADVLPALRAAVTDGEHQEGVRAFAVISLGRMQDRKSLSLVQTVLVSERDPGMRRAAAVALGKIATAADASAVTALTSAMTGDKDPVTRHFATMSLGGIADPKIRALLREQFKKGAEGDASFAALALALQKDTESAPELRAALAKETDESAAGSLCIALGLLGDAPSGATIEKTLAGAKHLWLQGYAALSLGLVGATSSIPAIHARLGTEKDPRLRVNLAIALGLLRDPVARTYLVDTLRGADTFYERTSAVFALGALRCTAAVSDIEVVYRDTKEKDILRAFAVVALGEIADPSPVPKLSRFSIDGNYDATAKIDPLNEVLTIY
jgi:HEAT repeat protein